MSEIDKMIKEFCPNGIENKPLHEIATVSRGGNFQKKDYVETGFPCIHYGQIYTTYGLFVNETVSFISEENAVKQKKAVTGDIIMAVTSENIEDVCKCVPWLYDFPPKAKERVIPDGTTLPRNLIRRSSCSPALLYPAYV